MVNTFCANFTFPMLPAPSVLSNCQSPTIRDLLLLAPFDVLAFALPLLLPSLSLSRVVPDRLVLTVLATCACASSVMVGWCGARAEGCVAGEGSRAAEAEEEAVWARGDGWCVAKRESVLERCGEREDVRLDGVRIEPMLRKRVYRQRVAGRWMGDGI